MPKGRYERKSRGMYKVRTDYITHCKHGHEYTAANTYISKSNGYRNCKQCYQDKNVRMRAAGYFKTYYQLNKDRINKMTRERYRRLKLK